MKKTAIITVSLIALALVSGFAYLPSVFEAKYTGPTMTNSDGKKLVTFVRLPEGDGPFPTLIVRSPYELPHTPLSGMPAEDFTDVPDSDLGQTGWPLVTEAGYALVVQHTRGRVGSEGAALGLKDRQDAVELIQWIKKQPWSNGKIGTTGDSIEAITAMLTNSERPDLVDASYVQIGTPNLINGALKGPGGALKFETFFPWGAEQILTADPKHYDAFNIGHFERRRLILGMGLKVSEIFSDLDNPHEMDVWKRLPLKDYPYFSELGTGWNDMLDATPTSEVAKHYDASDTTVPTFYVAAWHDVFAPSQLTAFADAEKQDRDQRLLILNGTHFTPENPGAWPIAPMLPWFDYHLKGETSALMDMPRVIFPVANEIDEWYGTNTWPTPAAKTVVWNLSADGGISSNSDTPTQAGMRSYAYDPQNPVPTVGGRNLMISHGTLDQRSIRQGQRDDVLSYDSDPLMEETLIAGPVYGKLAISSDAKDTDFTVKLLDIAPDGTATLVTEGILRSRFREGLGKEVFMKSGETYEITVDMGPIAWRFKAGHRLAVDVSSSNFPQWDRNLNTGAPLFSTVETVIANNTIHHGGVIGSRIELPVVTNWDGLTALTDFKTTVGK